MWHYLKLWDSWSVRLGPHSDPPVFYIHPRLHGHLQRGLSRKPECCKWCCFSFILIASAENSLQINPLSLCFKGTVSKYKLGVSNPGLVFDVFVEFERLFSLDDVLLALRFFYLWSSKSSLLVLCPLVVSYACSNAHEMVLWVLGVVCWWSYCDLGNVMIPDNLEFNRDYEVCF